MNPIPTSCKSKANAIPIVVLRNEGDQLIAEYTCYKIVEVNCAPCHCSAPISPNVAHELFICNKDIHIETPCEGFNELLELYQDDPLHNGCCLGYKPDLYQVNFLVELLRKSVPIHKDDVEQLAKYFGPYEAEFIINGFRLEDDYWFSPASPLVGKDSPHIQRMKSAVVTRAVLSSVFFASETTLFGQWGNHVPNLPPIQEVFGNAELNVHAYKDLFYGIFPYTASHDERLEWEFGPGVVEVLESTSTCLEYGYYDVMQFHILDDGITAPGIYIEAIKAFCAEFGDGEDIVPEITIYSSRLNIEGEVDGCDIVTIDLATIGSEEPKNWMDRIYNEWVSRYAMSYKALEKMGSYDMFDEKWYELYRRPDRDNFELED